jgi:competence protein ComGF
MRESQTLKQKSNGYTLLTMMVALATLTIIAGLIANLALATFNHHHYESIDRKDVWLFLVQIQDDMIPGQHFSESESRLSFELNGDTIDYQLIGTNILRRVNGNGYEIVLKNVQNLSFKDNDQNITILLTDTNGRSYRWAVKKMIQ